MASRAPQNHGPWNLDEVGLLPWLGRMFLAPRLHAANQAMFDDLARTAGHSAATPKGNR